MARTPSMFRQSDVARALRGARDGGLDVGSVEIDPRGTITVFAKKDGAQDGHSAPVGSSATSDPKGAFDEYEGQL